VALNQNFLAAGAPLYEANGAVFTLVFIGGNWEIQPPITGQGSGDLFGSSLDVLGDHMVVGAPSKPIVDTLAPAGAAYVYSYNASEATWQQMGPDLRSAEDLFAANGEFGASVAIGLSSLSRVVVGAPMTSKDIDTLETGRVYTFEALGTAWAPLETTPLYGKNPSNFFGASVDMTNDGEIFIAGAPGNGTLPGYFQIYGYDSQNSEWTLEFEQEGDSSELLGSCVKVLSKAKDLLAVGGPGFQDGAGRVYVFQKNSNKAGGASAYVQLGEPIVGKPGEKLGAPNSITGGQGQNGPLLILSTSSGAIKTFIFDSSSDSWVEDVELLAAAKSGIALDYSEEDGLITGHADTDVISLYMIRSTSIASPFVASSTVPDSTPVSSPASNTPAAPIASVSIQIPSVNVPAPIASVSIPNTDAPSVNVPGTDSPVSDASITSPVNATQASV
jgi:FG-GAP repeat